MSLIPVAICHQCLTPAANFPPVSTTPVVKYGNNIRLQILKVNLKAKIYIVDTGGKFTTGITVSTTLGKLVAKFAANVVDTGGKFIAGVVDTSGKFAIGVIDTGDSPCLANISANFRKNLKLS